MIRSLLAAALLFVSGTSLAQVPFSRQLAQFCGIKDDLDSTKIEDCYAQDAQNVLTEQQRIETIPGSAVAISEVLSGHKVKAAWSFIDGSGNKWLILHSSSSLYYTDFKASPTKFPNNVDASLDLDMVAGFGKAWFTNSADTGFNFDGASTAAVSAMPLAKYLEFQHERVIVGNTSTSDSEVRVSSFGSGVVWAVPANVSADPEAPNSFKFDEDNGCAITCLKATPWGLFVGKECSTHILKGVDNDTYYKRYISPSIGCVDDRLVVMTDSHLLWLAKEGYYAWDGAGSPEPVSNDLTERVKTIKQSFTNAEHLRLNTQSDWEAGSLALSGPGAKISSTIDPGSIVPSTFGVVVDTQTEWNAGTHDRTFVDAASDLRASSKTISQPTNADFETGVLAPHLCSTGASSDLRCGITTDSITGVYSSSSGYNSATPHDAAVRAIDVSGSTKATSSDYEAMAPNATQGDSFNTTTYSGQVVRLALRVITGASDEAVLYSSTFTAGTSVSWNVHNVAGKALYTFDDIVSSGVAYQSTGTWTSPVYDTGISTTVGGAFVVDMTSSTDASVVFEVRNSSNGADTFSAYKALTPGATIGLNLRYWQLRSSFSATVTTMTGIINSLTLQAATTGQADTKCLSVGGDISAWGAFSCQQTETGASYIDIEMSTAPSCASISGTSYTFINNNQVPSIATAAAAKFRFTFNIPASSTDTLAIDACTLNWTEGTSPRGASAYHDRRSIFCVATGDQPAVNDSCDVLQRNGFWARLKGPKISALTVYDREPYAGDGEATSRIWKVMQSTETSFAGSTIDAYWVSKDFNEGAAANDKTIREIWLDAPYESGASVDVGYSVNRSTSYVESAIALDGTADHISTEIPFAAGFVKGRVYRIRLRNADAEERMKVNQVSVYGEVEPRF